MKLVLLKKLRQSQMKENIAVLPQSHQQSSNKTSNSGKLPPPQQVPPPLVRGANAHKSSTVPPLLRGVGNYLFIIKFCHFGFKSYYYM